MLASGLSQTLHGSLERLVQSVSAVLCCLFEAHLAPAYSVVSEPDPVLHCLTRL